MALHCDGCNTDLAHRIQIKFEENEEGNLEKVEICDMCGSVGNASVPDIYFKGAELNQNITDRLGRPIPLTSRRQKAEVMKKLGYQEAGDFHHGSRIGRG